MKFNTYVIQVEGVTVYVGEGEARYTDATSGKTQAGRMERHRTSILSYIKGFKIAKGANDALYRYVAEKWLAGHKVSFVSILDTDSKAEAYARQEEEIAKIVAKHGREALPFNAQINGSHTSLANHDHGDKIEGMIRGKYLSRLAVMTDEERKRHQYALAKESRDRVRIGVYKRKNKLSKLTTEQYRDRINFRTNCFYHRRRALQQSDTIRVNEIEKQLADYDVKLGLDPEPVKKVSGKGRPWARMTREEETLFLAPFVARCAPLIEVRAALEERFGKYSLKCVYDLYHRHQLKTPRAAKSPQWITLPEKVAEDSFTEAEKSWMKRLRRTLLEKIEKASLDGRFEAVNELSKKLADVPGQLKLAKEQGKFLTPEFYQNVSTL